jgi:hypothetical protein
MNDLVDHHDGRAASGLDLFGQGDESTDGDRPGLHVEFVGTRSTRTGKRGEIQRGSLSPGIRREREGESNMRVMVIVKANEDSEAGVMPSEQLLTEMGAFNEELVKAGVMLDGDGLKPSSEGARVRFSGSQRTVIDGPFVETKELIAGYWIWKVESLDEAIEWVKRCPNPMSGESEIEIRPIFEAEDFGEEFTPELREQEERLRAQLSAQQGT